MRLIIAVVGAVVATIAVASPITSSSPLSQKRGPPGPKGPMGPGAGVAASGPCAVCRTLTCTTVQHTECTLILSIDELLE